MWDLRVCRGCLLTGEEGKLEPINTMLKMGYQALTGLEIKNGDGYPTYFCLTCCVHIKKALAFKRKSRRAFFAMREIMIVRNEVSIKDIQTINREKMHLNPCSTYWNMKNNIIYNIEKTEDEDDSSMVKYTPLIDNLVCHTVEVTPEITQNEEETPTIDNIDDVDNIDNIVSEDFIPDEIDLEDVFKDLKEASSSSESETEEEINKEVVKKPPLYTPKLYPFNVPIFKACKALCNADITVLSELEQKSIHEMRSKMQPYRTSKYKCGMCLIVFEDMVMLMKHVEEHKVGHGKYACKICRNAFKTEELLKRHTVERHLCEYKCKTCSKVFYSALDIISHNNKLHREVMSDKDNTIHDYDVVSLQQRDMYTQRKMLICTKCNKYFKTRNSWAEHVSQHKDAKQFYCDICLLEMSSKGKIHEHMKIHLFHYKCRQCDRVFKKKSVLIHHLLKCKLWPTKCDICNMEIMSEDHLNSHNRCKHYVEVYTHTCNICGLAYSQLSLLYKHQIRRHNYISLMDHKLQNPEHSCSICNMQFITRKAYETHSVLAGHPEAREFANCCFQCKRVFENQEECKEHQLYHPKHNKYPRSCDFCEAILKSENARKDHHKRFHDHLEYKECQNKMKLCEICGVVLMSSIRKHMNRHIGDVFYKFECNKCEVPTRWPNTYNYVNHMLVCHTIKPYHCAICHSAFRFRISCRDHILKTHAPVMLYSCSICNQQFPHHDFLVDHSLKDHAIKINKISNKSRRVKRHIFVYPHMKIDVSQIEREILNSLNIDLYDYMHKKLYTLDDKTEYLITEPTFQYLLAPKKRKAQTKDRTTKRVKLNETIITTTVICGRKKKDKNKEEYTDDMYKNNEENIVDNICENEDNNIVSEDVKSEDVKSVESVLEDTNEQELEVIEIEGDNYVMIDEVMYKVEVQ